MVKNINWFTTIINHCSVFRTTSFHRLKEYGLNESLDTLEEGPKNTVTSIYYKYMVISSISQRGFHLIEQLHTVEMSKPFGNYWRLSLNFRKSWEYKNPITVYRPPAKILFYLIQMINKIFTKVYITLSPIYLRSLPIVISPVPQYIMEIVIIGNLKKLHICHLNNNIELL